MSESALAVGIDRGSHYDWIHGDPDYAVAFDYAQRCASRMLEDVAKSRAVDGVVRKKFGKDGEPIIDPETGLQYVEREYSDTLLIFLLKGNNPEKFRERHEVKHGGEVGLKLYDSAAPTEGV